MQPVTPDPTAPGPAPSHAGTTGAGCASCATRALQPEQYLYAIGRVDVRFPSLGIEREYQQRERALHDLPQPRGARVRAVLEANPHVALRIGYVLVIGGSPAFALSPSSPGLKEAFLTAVAQSHEADRSCVVIGRVGGVAHPPAYGGLLLPTVAVDQLYTFSGAEWSEQLSKVARPALESRKLDAAHFSSVAQAALREMAAMPENLGVSDGHRALNYLLVQHPGIFLAIADRRHHALDRIETRVIQAAGGRRQVAVILHFLDRGTGVPERVYCLVDVTEEWPFVVTAEGSASPLGFAPFLDSALYGSG